MIPVYYSHSYRDVPINGYFFGLLGAVDIRPMADQKSEVWCVAKLERYLHELDAFVSVIPRRAATKSKTTYSPYIGHELALARRVRLPRLLFVDELLLKTYPGDFPKDAVPFIYEEPAAERKLHAQTITDFRADIEKLARQPLRAYTPRKAVVVTADGSPKDLAAECICQALDEENYEVQVVAGKDLPNAYSDVRILETLLDAEICVFLLGKRLAWTHVLLAMAHAQGVPSIRLRYDPRTEKSEPSLHGIVPWREIPALEAEFKQQLHGFRRGFVDSIGISADHEEAAQEVGTMKWNAAPTQFWNSTDGPALLDHLEPDALFIQDEVSRVRRSLGGGALADVRDRTGSMKVCRQLYAGLQRHHWAYEWETGLLRREEQKIRSPGDIETHQSANCVDLACLFSSLLLAAHQYPVIAVVERKGFAHALVGYRLRGEPALSDNAKLGDALAGLARGDLVLFEPTGAVQAAKTVSAETTEERQEANNMLQFAAARSVAERVLRMKDLGLRYLVDVKATRR